MKKIILTLISVLILQQALLWANPPQWSVDASQYEFSMTITSLVYIDGAMANSPDNILAAMVGEQVRGVAMPIHDSYNDRYLYFLTIFSNQFSGEAITFSYYDAASNTTIDLWNGMTFTSASNQGGVTNPYLFFSEQPDETSVVSFIIEDVEGTPVNGATVLFDGQDVMQETYTVQNVFAGTYAWSVELEGYISQSGIVTVAAGIPLVEVTVVLQPMVPNPDVFTVQFTVNAPDGNPVTNVTIQFIDQTFENQLIFDDIESGTYPYQIVSEGYVSAVGQVTVASANVHVQITLQLLPEIPDPDTYAIEFTVLDGNGNPLDGVAITFNNELYTGQLMFSGLEPGVYSYNVNKEGYVSKSGEVTLTTANVHVQITLQLLPEIPDPETYEIHFSVTDLDGNLLEGVEILLNGDAYAGQQVISNLVPGEYNYKASKSGYISREGQIIITSSNVFIAIILLEQFMNTNNPDSIELKVYPNPATNFVRIDAAQQTLISSIEVYNTSGRQVMYAEGYSFGDKIDIAPLAKGVYLFTIVLQTGERIVEKLVIN